MELVDYKPEEHVRIPMITYIPEATIVSNTTYTAGGMANTSGVRLGASNHWLVLRATSPRGHMYTVWGSFILQRVPEFCGGALLHGVHLRVHKVTTDNCWLHPNTRYGCWNRSALFWGGYPKEYCGADPRCFNSHVFAREVHDGTSPFPEIGALLGRPEEPIALELAEKYMMDVMGEAIMRRMYLLRQRILFSADTTSGALGHTMTRLRSRLGGRRGAIVAINNSLNVEWAALTAPQGACLESLRKYRGSVQISAPTTNWNSGSLCRRYTLRLATSIVYRGEGLTSSHERVMGTFPNEPTTQHGRTKLGRLALHAPLYMPTGCAQQVLSDQ